MQAPEHTAGSRGSTHPQGRAGAGSVPQTVASLLWLPQAGLLAHALQSLLEGGGARAVVWPAAMLLALGLARGGLEAWGLRRSFRAACERLGDLRAQVARALAARSPLDAARPASGLAASVMAEQAEAVVPYLTRYQPARCKALVVPLAILAAVFPLSWIAALVLLVAAPLIPVFMALVGWRAKAASEAQMVEIGGMNAFLLDRLRGLASLRALGAVDFTAQRLRAAGDSLRRRTMAVLRIAFLSSAVLELFAALGVAMVAAYVGFHLLGQLNYGAWGVRLSLGQGLFVLLLAPAFFEPLRELSLVWHDRAAGEAALAAMARLSEAGTALPGANDAAVPPMAASRAARPPALCVRALEFSHAGTGGAVFDGLDFDVAAGEHVALLADSGAGKTTLLSLLAGLVPVQGGSIRIGDETMSAATASRLRQRTAWLGQKPHIFAGTVQANVALGQPGVGAAEVSTAMWFAALGATAQAHAGAMLGEGGVGLSGGEAVRLALARAVVRPQADLLLVDEPTAHLDAATAEAVTEALLQLAHGKTMLVATHDPVLAARLDRSLRLHAGLIEASEVTP
ncbi:thiol reductant ABC exporter subunit CydD [Rhodoferax koreense]|uniref:Thiol reductant ABC exporter subunit CydD n=1 Tax=Rhodoferax koreensis TaxID=1842727 RepID=A0A1P8JYS4_9BURK|nr:thiol reductant ABC exporter subunit CydD [Rhodoferax koreense]APW38841.1 thiol reductant ABC exporter subunit CydD [Rhodoferax koreense]